MQLDEAAILRRVRELQLPEILDPYIGTRPAGDPVRAVALRIAEERLAEYREPGELFVVRMLQPGAEGMTIVGLDLGNVRRYLAVG